MQYHRIYVGLIAKAAVLKKLIFLPFLLILLTSAFAQVNNDSLVVKLDSLANSLNIEKNTLVYIDSIDNLQPGNIPDSKFILLSDLKYKKYIPARLLPFPVYLQFTVQNNAASTAEYCFYPGMYYNNIALYKKSADGNLEQLGRSKTHAGFVYISLEPGQRSSYLLKLNLAKTVYDRITAVIMKQEYQQSFVMELSNSYRDKRIASYILCGVLLMFILFTLVNYFLSYKVAFLYHCFFSMSMFLLIFFTSYLTRRPGWFSAFFMGYLDLMLLIIGTIFYLAFIRKFLDTKNRHVLLDKLFMAEAWILTILMFIFSYVHFETNNIILGDIIENSMKILALLIGMVFIVKGLRDEDRPMKYLAMGSAAQIFFSIISLVIILSGRQPTSLLNSALFYFEVGIIMALFFFLLGLTYQNRHELIKKTKEQEATKLEVEKKVFETKLAVINAQQEERNRISADMHDDLGAGMTSIRLFSELAKAKMGDKVIPEIEKISASADELLNKMNAIIWSMSSSNDSLGNMIAYIRSYGLDYFENTGIDCRVTIPEDLPEMEVSGIIRRNVFLVIKEALNNIVKHSGATVVIVTMKKEEKGLSLTIHDNGKGIDFEKIRQFGNGLKNMKKRMDDVGIEFYIENNNGTVVRLYREIEEV